MWIVCRTSSLPGHSRTHVHWNTELCVCVCFMSVFMARVSTHRWEDKGSPTPTLPSHPLPLCQPHYRPQQEDINNINNTYLPILSDNFGSKKVCILGSKRKTHEREKVVLTLWVLWHKSVVSCWKWNLPFCHQVLLKPSIPLVKFRGYYFYTFYNHFNRSRLWTPQSK